MDDIEGLQLKRYERAKALMRGIWTSNIALNATIIPTWIGDTDSFWYECETNNGRVYKLVNARNRDVEIVEAFNHTLLGLALSRCIDGEVDPNNLPISQVEIETDPTIVRFTAMDKRWLFLEDDQVCREIQTDPKGFVVSPDQDSAVFAKDDNLYLRRGGEDIQLTLDGYEDLSYGATCSAWGTPLSPSEELQVRWAPRSKKLYVVRRDTRGIKTLPLINHLPVTGGIRPEVDHIKVSYPEDDSVESLELAIIHIDSGYIQDINYGPIASTRNGFGFFSSNLGWWSNDSRFVFFVDVSEDYRSVKVVRFDTLDETIKVIFEECAKSHINLSLNADEYPTFLPLPASDEIIWFSERSGYAHLYLYCLKTGALKNSITSGEWVVRNIVSFDPIRREVFAQTSGRCKKWDPYYKDLVRIDIDTGDISTLISRDLDCMAIAHQTHHTITISNIKDVNKDSCAVSPTGNFFVVTLSRADQIPVSSLFDRNGDIVLELEVANISSLYSEVSSDFIFPEPVKLKAADNKTDIYGLVFRPSDFSPDNVYPVVDFTNNSPDFPLVPKGSFSNGTVLDWVFLSGAMLAELGFIVVQIDGRGTSFRSKAFQDESYGKIHYANNLDDHIAGIKQLAGKYSYMDLSRVGITTHATDGPGALLGLLKYPDFYKVGVAFSVLDSRLMSSSMWSNMNGGVSEQKQDDRYFEDMVKNLKGKLLLMHGMRNMICPPAGVFRIIEALRNANKDFDLLLLPNCGNDPDSYLIRRACDYLVRHLAGVEPPREFLFSSVFDGV